jgi:hypothetical protein
MRPQKEREKTNPERQVKGYVNTLKDNSALLSYP